jgi:enoyl-CoA hydratase/carnithine racemase
MTESTPDLGVERRGPVLWLTMQREARRNALSPAVAGLGKPHWKGR